MFPNLLISTTDPAYNLTVTNAASADNTLTVCLIVAVIGMPFVLLYTPASTTSSAARRSSSRDSY